MPALSLWTAALLTLCSIDIALGAPESVAANAGDISGPGYESVNGWDLRVSEETANSAEQPTLRCRLSSTMLVRPGLGAVGGRVTLEFEAAESRFAASATVTGGNDPRRPIEILVDGHLIADKVPIAGSVKFGPSASKHLTALFRAGRQSWVRLNRGGKTLVVAVSLAGFTQASRTAARRCN